MGDNYVNIKSPVHFFCIHVISDAMLMVILTIFLITNVTKMLDMAFVLKVSN